MYILLMLIGRDLRLTTRGVPILLNVLNLCKNKENDQKNIKFRDEKINLLNSL